MIDYTGHPLIDVGMAALTAAAGCAMPSELTAADLRAVAEEVAALYTTSVVMQSHLRGMVLLNAGYWAKRQADRDAWARRVLFSWQDDSPYRVSDPCAFCGRPAAYRAGRDEVPLLTGRNMINFGAGGQPGFPICGFCSLAAQMLPLGCIKSRGLIAIHSDHTALMRDLAGEALRGIRTVLTLASEEVPLDTLPTAAAESTRFAEQVVRWMARAERRRAAAVTAYCFSSGQQPALRILRLDAAVVGWLDEVLHPDDLDVRAAWQRTLQQGWLPGKGAPTDGQGRNMVYEALLTLPGDALRFWRRWLRPVKHWGLTETYLRRIMGMTPERIALLREVGLRFAAYASRKGSKFTVGFMREQNYAAWRRLVLRADEEQARAYGETIITFDEFIELFTAPPGEVNDWRLMRDLIALIMIEAGLATSADDAEAIFADDLEVDETEKES